MFRECNETCWCLSNRCSVYVCICSPLGPDLSQWSMMQHAGEKLLLFTTHSFLYASIQFDIAKSIRIKVSWKLVTLLSSSHKLQNIRTIEVSQVPCHRSYISFVHFVYSKWLRLGARCINSAKPSFGVKTYWQDSEKCVIKA